MKVPYTNTSKNTVQIGGKSIRPGETREIEATLHPDYHRPPAAAAPEPGNPMLEMLDDSVANIIEQLPDVSDDELGQLVQAEADGKKRKTLMAAFEEEKLRRAQTATAAGGDSDDQEPADEDDEGAGDQGTAGDEHEDTGESE